MINKSQLRLDSCVVALVLPCDFFCLSRVSTTKRPDANVFFSDEHVPLHRLQSPRVLVLLTPAPSAIFPSSKKKEALQKAKEASERVFPRTLAPLIVNQKKEPFRNETVSVTFTAAQIKELPLSRRRQKHNLSRHSSIPSDSTPRHHWKKTFEHLSQNVCLLVSHMKVSVFALRLHEILARCVPCSWTGSSAFLLSPNCCGFPSTKTLQQCSSLKSQTCDLFELQNSHVHHSSL